MTTKNRKPRISKNPDLTRLNKLRNARKQKEKYGIKVEPYIINGEKWDQQKFMLENCTNPNWKQHPDFLEYQRQATERRITQEKVKMEMAMEGMDVTVRASPVSKEEKQEKEASDTTYTAVINSMKHLEVVKEIAKQQVPELMWQQAQKRGKLTPEQLESVSLEKLLALTKVLTEATKGQMIASAKIIDIPELNRMKKSATLKSKPQEIDFSKLSDVATVQDPNDPNEEPKPAGKKISNLINKIMN